MIQSGRCDGFARRVTAVHSPLWGASLVVFRFGAGNLVANLAFPVLAPDPVECGADIRFIQAMLGHADLRTTQIYTHVAVRQLQEIHRATHPAKLEREKQEIQQALAAEGEDDGE